MKTTSCQFLPCARRIALSSSSPSDRVVSSRARGFVSTYPQRLQRPWVLVWLEITVRNHGQPATLWRGTKNIPLAEAGGTLGYSRVSALLFPAPKVANLDGNVSKQIDGNKKALESQKTVEKFVEQSRGRDREGDGHRQRKRVVIATGWDGYVLILAVALSNYTISIATSLRVRSGS